MIFYEFINFCPFKQIIIKNYGRNQKKHKEYIGVNFRLLSIMRKNIINQVKK